MPASAGWVCQSDALPGVLWTASEDRTGILPGWTCSRLETPLPLSPGYRVWATFWKLLKLTEGL